MYINKKNELKLRLHKWASKWLKNIFPTRPSSSSCGTEDHKCSPRDFRLSWNWKIWWMLLDLLCCYVRFDQHSSQLCSWQMKSILVRLSRVRLTIPDKVRLTDISYGALGKIRISRCIAIAGTFHTSRPAFPLLNQPLGRLFHPIKIPALSAVFFWRLATFCHRPCSTECDWLVVFHGIVIPKLFF